MWQRFTEDARRTILLAQEEALRAQSNHVDTEHLLVGLLRVDERIGSLLLKKAGAKVAELRAEAENVVRNYPKQMVLEAPRGLFNRSRSKAVEPTLASQAKRVLELAAHEARRMQHNYIGTEHLLLALIREDRGRASQILEAQGVDLAKTRTLVKNSSWAAELAEAQSSAKPSQSEFGDEKQLLSLLERRPDLLVEILGLDVLALKKARLSLLLRLDMFEEAAILRDEIENEHS